MLKASPFPPMKIIDYELKCCVDRIKRKFDQDNGSIMLIPLLWRRPSVEELADAA
jgi:hypothetical protein